jgi:hypothetical protein
MLTFVKNPGEMFIAGGGFPVYAIDVTSNGDGVFNGMGHSTLSRMFHYMKIRVTLKDVVINTDRRMIGGVVESVYDPVKNSMIDMDKVGRVKSGTPSVDVTLDFVIPQNAVLSLDEENNTITVSDINGNQVGNIDISEIAEARGEEEIFPITVQDSDKNIYRIDKVSQCSYIR